jgi:hypothetical protein
MPDHRDTLLRTLDENARVADSSEAPFYARLCRLMHEDVEQEGPTWDLLEPYADQPADEYYPFRALAGVHHRVLAGDAPELAAHFASTGGDGDADAAWPHVREAFEEHIPQVIDELRHPLQTNETARCGALAPGFLTVARETGKPLLIRELGASAGLNLHFDRYRYEQDGRAYGPADSEVRFTDHWEENTPPLDAKLILEERRGCDLAPIDPTTDEGRLSLLSYIWPDQTARFELLERALDIARELPVAVDQESADTWVERQLAELPAWKATVVFHSLFWMYLEPETQESIRGTIASAAERASEEAPLAWLRYEEAPDGVHCELRLTLWPGGEDRLLATGGFHLSPVRWVGESRSTPSTGAER